MHENAILQKRAVVVKSMQSVRQQRTVTCERQPVRGVRVSRIAKEVHARNLHGAVS